MRSPDSYHPHNGEKRGRKRETREDEEGETGEDGGRKEDEKER